MEKPELTVHEADRIIYGGAHDIVPPTKPTEQKGTYIRLAVAEIKERLQMRIEGTDGAYVEKLKAILEGGGNFDWCPPVVFWIIEEGIYILADGNHREAAFRDYHKDLGTDAPEMLIERREGTRQDAVDFAKQANLHHPRALSDASVKALYLQSMQADEPVTFKSTKTTWRRLSIGAAAYWLGGYPKTTVAFWQTGFYETTVDESGVRIRTPERVLGVDEKWYQTAPKPAPAPHNPVVRHSFRTTVAATTPPETNDIPLTEDEQDVLYYLRKVTYGTVKDGDPVMPWRNLAKLGLIVFDQRRGYSITALGHEWIEAHPLHPKPPSTPAAPLIPVLTGRTNSGQEPDIEPAPRLHAVTIQPAPVGEVDENITPDDIEWALKAAQEEGWIDTPAGQNGGQSANHEADETPPESAVVVDKIADKPDASERDIEMAILARGQLEGAIGEAIAKLQATIAIKGIRAIAPLPASDLESTIRFTARLQALTSDAANWCADIQSKLAKMVKTGKAYDEVGK